jgi:lactate dehydrogenase-like 2-hydroxyacid dehydrogenase
MMDQATEAGSRPVIAVTRTALPGDGIAALADIAELRTWPEDRNPSPPELAALTAGATIILGPNGDRIDAALLDAVPSLKLIAVASAGYDTIDAAAAAERGILVTHTPGVLHEATADLAFGLLLAARRRIAEADRWVRAGEWRSVDLRNMVGYDVHGATIGIVGLGEIGSAVARRALGFGMTVVHHSRTVGDTELSRWLPLDELLATADVVSIHVPISDETRGLIGERELGLMKSSATLVNAGRGGIVDEAALVAALRDGTIASAGLDVQIREPNPDADDPLLSVDNCVVVPHIGSATHAARAAMFDLAATNARDWLTTGTVRTPVPESRAIAKR